MDDQDDLHNERVKVIEDWHMNFKKGTDHDLWGQPVEASDAYQRYGARGSEMCGVQGQWSEGTAEDTMSFLLFMFFTSEKSFKELYINCHF